MAAAVALIGAGCGGGEEQTTVDLTGLVSVDGLRGGPRAEEKLAAALARNIQKRAPSNVKVVYTAGAKPDTQPRSSAGGISGSQSGAGGGTKAQPSDGGAVTPPFDICKTLPYACTHSELGKIIESSIGEAEAESPGIDFGPPSGQTQTCDQTVNQSSAASSLVRFNIAGVQANACVPPLGFAEVGNIQMQIVKLPDGTKPPEGGGDGQPNGGQAPGIKTVPEAGEQTVPEGGRDGGPEAPGSTPPAPDSAPPAPDSAPPAPDSAPQAPPDPSSGGQSEGQ